MFNGFSPRTIDFMRQLRLNNEKAWFDAHRSDFQNDFQLPMKELGSAAFKQLTDKYPQHKFTHKLSRIYKDARRLKGGEGPYRYNMWFSIESPCEQWMSVPVFWFELAPEVWSYGLGYYQARPETMAKLRARIDRDPKKFEQVVAFLDGQNEFVLEGSEYARKKEAPNDKVTVWYNKKSFSLIHRQPNGDELYSPELQERITNGYMSLIPLYNYLITLDSDPSPEK